MENLFTPQEVAEKLKIKKNTVYELIKRGELASSKIGKQIRISGDNLEQYLKSDVARESTSASVEHNSSEVLIFCGQDQILDLLCANVENHPKGMQTLRSHMGSYNSLNALYFKKVHFATSHLWNGKNNNYNHSYIEHLVPGTDVISIHLIKRNQGFYVKAGNPKKITSFEDFKRNDIKIANREKGCATRVLLDEHLRRIKITPSQISGYSYETNSHSSSAAAVASNMADVSIGCENALLQFPTLDFIPIQLESLDLIFLKEYEKLPAFKAVVEIIQSDKFRQTVSNMYGYDITDMGCISIL